MNKTITWLARFGSVFSLLMIGMSAVTAFQGDTTGKLISLVYFLGLLVTIFIPLVYLGFFNGRTS